MDYYTAQARERTQGPGTRAALMVIVIALGLVVGAVGGLIAAFWLGLITITC